MDNNRSVHISLLHGQLAEHATDLTHLDDEAGAPDKRLSGSRFQAACNVPGCNIRFLQKMGIRVTTFKVPAQNKAWPKLWYRWIHALGFSSAEEYSQAGGGRLRICELHFTDDCFFQDIESELMGKSFRRFRRKSLTLGAYPTLDISNPDVVYQEPKYFLPKEWLVPEEKAKALLSAMSKNGGVSVRSICSNSSKVIQQLGLTASERSKMLAKLGAEVDMRTSQLLEGGQARLRKASTVPDELSSMRSFNFNAAPPPSGVKREQTKIIEHVIAPVLSIFPDGAAIPSDSILLKPVPNESGEQCQQPPLIIPINDQERTLTILEDENFQSLLLDFAKQHQIDTEADALPPVMLKLMDQEVQIGYNSPEERANTKKSSMQKLEPPLPPVNSQLVLVHYDEHSQVALYEPSKLKEEVIRSKLEVEKLRSRLLNLQLKRHRSLLHFSQEMGSDYRSCKRSRTGEKKTFEKAQKENEKLTNELKKLKIERRKLMQKERNRKAKRLKSAERRKKRRDYIMEQIELGNMNKSHLSLVNSLKKLPYEKKTVEKNRKRKKPEEAEDEAGSTSTLEKPKKRRRAVNKNKEQKSEVLAMDNGTIISNTDVMVAADEVGVSDEHIQMVTEFSDNLVAVHPCLSKFIIADASTLQSGTHIILQTSGVSGEDYSQEPLNFIVGSVDELANWTKASNIRTIPQTRQY